MKQAILKVLQNVHKIKSERLQAILDTQAVNPGSDPESGLIALSKLLGEVDQLKADLAELEAMAVHIGKEGVDG